MKTISKSLLTLAFIFFFAVSASAQVGRIETTTVEYDKQRVDALTVNIKPERKDIQKAFDDWMDDRYDINMKGGGLFGNKNIEKAEEVVIPGISRDNITLITKTEEMNGETRMSIFATKGLNNYIGRDDYTAFTGMENVFDGFLNSYLPEYYEERVAEAREALEDLRKDYDKAKEDMADNRKEIEKLQKENRELETEMRGIDQKIKDAELMLRERENSSREVVRSVRNRR